VNVKEHLPATFTPEDDITQWVQLGSPSAATPGTSQIPIANSSAVLYTGGPNGGPNAYYNSNGSLYAVYNNSTQYSFYQQNLSNVGLWAPLRMSNNEYGNWHDLNTNGTHQDNTLTNFQVSVDQEILPGLTSTRR
jgi:hypothetical protein